MAPLLAEVQLALNERSADQVADQIQRTLSQSGSESSRAFGTTFNRHMADVGDEAAKSIQNALRGSVDEAVRGMSSQFGSMGGVAQSALSGISTGAAAAGLGVAALVVGVIKVGDALYDVGKRWDDLSDTISVQTGRMGDDLDQLMNTVKDVGATTAASFETIGDIVGQLSQSMPGLSGNSSAMREMASNLAYLAENGQKVDIRDLGRSMKAFGVESNDASSALDDLYAASARTGVPMNELLKNLVNVGSAARTLGLDFEDTTGLLVNFETAGLDASGAAMALNSAAKVFADSNIPLQSGLKDTVTQIRGFIDAGKDAAAVDLAGKVFGERGAERFVDLIRQDKLNLDDLKGSLGDTGNKIGNLKDSTEDWSEQWDILKNRVSELAEIAGGPLFDKLNKALGVVNTILSKTPDMLALGGPSGPMPPGYDPGTIGSMMMPGYTGAPSPHAIPDIPGSALYAPGAVPPWMAQIMPPPPPSGGWPDDTPPQDIAGALADAKKSGSEPKLPDAPVVPRAGLPALMPGLQLTSSLLGAQQGVADAETKVAEAKARVLQLDGTNIATEQDRLEARNALAKANEDKAQADLRFSEAQQSALKSQSKALDDTSKKLGALGAQLDADFGASGGLPGILENATKALANLGFAPVLGALRGVQVANGYDQSDLGGGIIGALGATGAFGKQFVKSQDPYSPLSSGAGSAAASLNNLATAANTATGALGGSPSLGSSALGGISDTELLSRVPAGSYQTPDEAAGSASWDLTKGLGDCSSAVEDLVNLMDGRPTAGRSLSTGNAAEWLPQHGFLPGLGGPGDFRVGYNDHHMQATTAGGVPFNWGSDAAAARGGIGGTGADDPSFTDHWYRPMTTPMSSIPGLDGPLLSPSSAPSSPSAPGAASVPSTSGSDPLGLGLPTYGGLTSQQLTDPGLTPMPGGGSGGPRTSGLPRGLAPGFGIPGAPSILGMDPGGADPSQSVAGGRAFGQGVPASGGIGFGGGLIGLAGSAAQSALAVGGLAADAAGGGGGGSAGAAVASAAMQIGIQEIQRAISAGGQYVGALAGGLLETFSLNDSALADPGKSWLGRIGVAVAGARPALPNSAGEMGGKENKNMAEGGKKPPGPMSPQQAKGGKGGQPGADGANGSNVGKGDGTTYNLSVTNNNNNTRFDPTHNDMQNLMSASAASRQPR